jgi:hypothetical protein
MHSLSLDDVVLRRIHESRFLLSAHHAQLRALHLQVSVVLLLDHLELFRREHMGERVALTLLVLRLEVERLLLHLHQVGSRAVVEMKLALSAPTATMLFVAAPAVAGVAVICCTSFCCWSWSVFINGFVRLSSSGTPAFASVVRRRSASQRTPVNDWYSWYSRYFASLAHA